MAKTGVTRNLPVGKTIIWVILIIQLGIVAWLFKNEFGKPSYKIGYVEISQVYDKFYLTKKLNQDFERMQTAKQGQMDTLKIRIATLEMDIKGGNKSQVDQYNKLIAQYSVMEEQINNDNLLFKINIWNKYLHNLIHS